MSEEYIPFKKNAELESIAPKYTKEKFEALKNDISLHKVVKPILIMEDGTIIDGYNRYTAVQEIDAMYTSLQKHNRHMKDALPVDTTSSIPQTIVHEVKTIEQALIYSYRINNLERNPTTYQKIAWGLKVYKEKYTDRELEKLIGEPHSSISKIRTLNTILVQFEATCPEIIAKYKEKLETRDAKWTVILEELKAAALVDEIIIARTSGNLAHRKELQEKYKTLKFEKNAIKKIEDEFKVKEPEIETTPYDAAVKKIANLIVPSRSSSSLRLRGQSRHRPPTQKHPQQPLNIQVTSSNVALTC